MFLLMSSDKEKPDNPFDFLTNSVLELFERLVVIQNSRSDNEKELWQFSSDFSMGLHLPIFGHRLPKLMSRCRRDSKASVVAIDENAKSSLVLV
jgi:hypothetical protein